jgi:probable HAF family extracellular repeat protein
MRRSTGRFTGSIVCAVALLVAAAAEGREYSLTAIPRGAFDAIGGRTVGDGGHVVGVRTHFDQPLRPWNGYVWTREAGLMDLGEGPIPMDVNAHGVVVGRQSNPLLGSGAFVWTAADGVRPLSSLPGGAALAGAGTELTGINAAGQMLGNTGDGLGRPFIREPDGTVRFLPLPSASVDLPLDYAHTARLSESGDALGQIAFSDDSGGYEWRGAVWRGGGEPQLLGDLPGGYVQSSAADMNRRGQVLGQGTIGGPGESNDRVVLWEPDGTMRDLGALPGMLGSRAGGINDLGEVVGVSYANGAGRPFLWTDAGGMVDLTTLLDASAGGWTLEGAQGINNAGQILVWGLFDGAPSTALLTPVPEPVAAAVLAVAAALSPLARRRARRD